MGKTQYGGKKRVQPRITYKKTSRILDPKSKPIDILKNLAKNSKKNINSGREIFRTKFLKKKVGIQLPKLFKMKGGMHCNGSTKKSKSKKPKGKKTKGKK